MPSILTSPFSINGVISTDKTVVQNMNTICDAAGAWMTYDITQGKWSVIINRAGTSVASFNDSNILGAINVSGTGVTELYNSAVITHPHKDLRDATDSITLTVSDSIRFENEIDNTLNIESDLVNDPVQAQYLASVELKQSRVDKVIEFRTDFSKLGLKAGDLIDITTDVYGYNAKVFRITKVTEQDSEDVLTLSITALEYDADVYDPSSGLSIATLTRQEKTKENGIKPITSNTLVAAKNNAGTANSLSNFFSNPLALGALGLPAILRLLGSMSKVGSGATARPGLTITTKFFGANAIIVDPGAYRDFTLSSFQAPLTGNYRVNYQINWGGFATLADGTDISPPQGVTKLSAITLRRNGTTVNVGDWGDTGDQHAQLYEDHILVGVFSATAGQTLEFGVSLATNFGPAFDEYYLNFNTGTTLRYNGASTNRAAVWITADLQYLGT
jgi:hypothetical protein